MGRGTSVYEKEFQDKNVDVLIAGLQKDAWELVK